MQEQFRGTAEASRAILANTSPRSRRLAALESWVDCTQYTGRASWWTGGEQKVPLWERAPCIVYPIVKIAIQSNTDLCLGQDRFPEISIEKPGDEETADETDDDQISPVDAFLGNLLRITRFATHCREALSSAQGTGTVVGIYGIRNGKPFSDLMPAKWCEPEFGKDTEVVKLTIQYPFVEEYKDKDGKWAVRTKLYKRVIDVKSDTTYFPAEANEQGTQPEWRVDKSQSRDHGLGFCPVVWYAFMRGCSAVNVIDGKAIHETITDEIQSYDIARSQWHRTALYSEPQIVEIGVTKGENPTGTGRTADVPATANGGLPGPNNPVTSVYRDPGSVQEGARLKGPGHVWQYPNEKTKVEVLQIASDTLQAQADNCSDLRLRIAEALSVVFLDPDNIKFATTTSGKAMDAIKERQLDRCDQIREDFRDGFLLPSLKMHLRIVVKQAKGVKVPGLDKAMAELSDGVDDLEIRADYGAYSKPDPTEQAAIIGLVQAAFGGGPNKGEALLTKKVAVQKIAPIFGIVNIERHLEQLQEEAEAKAEDQATQLERLGLAGTPPEGAAPGKPAAPKAPAKPAKPAKPKAPSAKGA